jgi:translation elongation factor P
MISTNDFRNGVTIEYDGQVWQVIEFQHVKPGKGSAFVRTKLKNLITGGTVERTFNAGERVAQARVERREMQYLYASGGEYTFMDAETYEQIQLSAEQVGEGVKYHAVQRPVDCRGTPQLRGPGGDGDGSWTPGRHRQRRFQAGEAGDWGRRQGAVVHRAG